MARSTRMNFPDLASMRLIRDILQPHASIQHHPSISGLLPLYGIGEGLEGTTKASTCVKKKAHAGAISYALELNRHDIALESVDQDQCSSMAWHDATRHILLRVHLWSSFPQVTHACNTHRQLEAVREPKQLLLVRSWLADRDIPNTMKPTWVVVIGSAARDRIFRNYTGLASHLNGLAQSAPVWNRLRESHIGHGREHFEYIYTMTNPAIPEPHSSFLKPLKIYSDPNGVSMESRHQEFREAPRPPLLSSRFLPPGFLATKTSPFGGIWGISSKSSGWVCQGPCRRASRMQFQPFSSTLDLIVAKSPAQTQLKFDRSETA
ncbi:hypothetical protein BDN72DRAFT_623899 [Pluteus cervinus]|uniref:Uncharacterized protein n=1 Tax=Pluteus cervinus TaxID=181527 RepID=A0ACD3AV20_9AGAR|nr:hypothetical protein BDN72DRAFT_623899 [Pluteus cervinus]